MKTPMQRTLRSTLAVLLLLGVTLALVASAWGGGAGAVAGVLAALVAAGLFAMLVRRLRVEDRAAARSAEQCLAHAGADEAVLEADLLLARLSAGSSRQGADPAGQLMMIQAELTHIQYGATDPAVAARLEHVRGRVERVAHALRRNVRAAAAS